MNDRLDYFIDRLYFYSRGSSLEQAVLNAKRDLAMEDKRQEEIEEKALEDAHFGDRYGKDE